MTTLPQRYTIPRKPVPPPVRRPPSSPNIYVRSSYRKLDTSESIPTPASSTPPGPPKPPDPVDGGLQGWIQVVGCFFCWFNSWGITNAFGIFQTYYQEDLLRQNTPSQIAWIGSIQSFLLIFVGVLTGPAYDAGYFHWLMWMGGFFVVFGYLMASLCKSYGLLMLTQGIIVGVGSGCLFIPSVSVLPQYFVKRRAIANGVAASGSNVGGLIYPIVVHRLLPQIGFAWTVRVVALLALVTCAIPLAVLRVRARPPKRRLLFDLIAFKEIPFTSFTVSLFFGLMGLYIPTFYIDAFAASKRIANENLGAYILPILNAGGVAGRIIPNLVADKTGPLNILVPCYVVAGVLAFAWIGVRDLGGLVAFALMYGFCSGAILSLPTVVIVSLSPSLGVIGTRMGTSFSVAALGLLIGTPASGAILTNTGSFVGLQTIAGATLLMAAALAAFSRLSKTGRAVLIKA